MNRLVDSATLADSDALACLHRICLPQTWPEAQFSEWLTHPHYSCWVVRENISQLAGYLLVRHVVPEAEIVALAVHSDRQKQGVAAALLQHAITHLREETITMLHLEVAEDNVPALALYRRFGFSETGRRTDYYLQADGRKDALLMRLSF